MSRINRKKSGWLKDAIIGGPLSFLADLSGIKSNPVYRAFSKVKPGNEHEWYKQFGTLGYKSPTDRLKGAYRVSTDKSPGLIDTYAGAVYDELIPTLDKTGDKVIKAAEKANIVAQDTADFIGELSDRHSSVKDGPTISRQQLEENKLLRSLLAERSKLKPSSSQKDLDELKLSLAKENAVRRGLHSSFDMAGFMSDSEVKKKPWVQGYFSYENNMVPRENIDGSVAYDWAGFKPIIRLNSNISNNRKALLDVLGHEGAHMNKEENIPWWSKKEERFNNLWGRTLASDKTPFRVKKKMQKIDKHLKDVYGMDWPVIRASIEANDPWAQELMKDLQLNQDNLLKAVKGGMLESRQHERQAWLLGEAMNDSELLDFIKRNPEFASYYEGYLTDATGEYPYYKNETMQDTVRNRLGAMPPIERRKTVERILKATGGKKTKRIDKAYDLPIA